MSAQYFIAAGAEQRGPFALEQLLAAGMRPETLVWRDGMAQWLRADSVPEVAALFSRPAGPPPIAPGAPQAGGPQPGGPLPGGPLPYAPAQIVPPYNPANSNRVAAGVCGILFGTLGIHKFILGYSNAGVIMLLVSILTCGIGGIVMHIIGIIEGITYLTKTDQQFYDTYVAQRREWF